MEQKQNNCLEMYQDFNRAIINNVTSFREIHHPLLEKSKYVKKSRLWKYSLIFCIYFFSSCNSHEVAQLKKVDLSLAPEEYERIFNDALSTGSSGNLISLIDETDNSTNVRLELGNISKSTEQLLGKSYFRSSFFKDKVFFTFPQDGSQPIPNSRIFRATDQAIEDAVFSQIQKEMIRQLTKSILDLPDMNQTNGYIESFNSEVLSNAKISDEERLVLIEFSSALQSLINFINNGGVDLIRASLEQYLISVGDIESARILGCSVDTRNVMLGAVVGFASGATWGGITGATAGTFTVPVLGTAVGGIGGAVFGGAWGFASGAIGGVASELLGSCFRPDEPEFDGKQDANCNALLDYYGGSISNLPVSCLPSFDIPK